MTDSHERIINHTYCRFCHCTIIRSKDDNTGDNYIRLSPGQTFAFRDFTDYCHDYVQVDRCKLCFVEESTPETSPKQDLRLESVGLGAGHVEFSMDNDGDLCIEVDTQSGNFNIAWLSPESITKLKSWLNE